MSLLQQSLTAPTAQLVANRLVHLGRQGLAAGLELGDQFFVQADESFRFVVILEDHQGVTTIGGQSVTPMSTSTPA